MTGDQKRLFQNEIVVGRGVMVLQIASFCVSRNKTKREVDFKHGRLIGEYPAQLFAEVGWVDGWEAKIIPILQSVLATETGGDLWPVLPRRLINIFVRAWNRVGRNVTGSASQLEPAVAADAWEAAGRVPGSADFLALFAPSVSFEVVALRLRFFDGCCWCEVRTWALKQARLWKDSPHVLRENVRSAIHFLCALRWMIADLSENFLSPQLHSYGFSPVWVRTWVFRWLGLEKICTQVSHRCSLRGFWAVGSPSPDWMAYN